MPNYERLEARLARRQRSRFLLQEHSFDAPRPQPPFPYCLLGFIDILLG